MFKAIKNNKIIAISDTDNEFACLNKDGIESDNKNSVQDYEQYNGEYLLKTEIPAPTKEEQSEKRAQAYLAEVDTITAHIQRLRDTDPESDEIAVLLAERNTKVAAIKERYPY